jgi:hypothetical protein
MRKLFEFRASFLEYLSPFIWGALGSCVFLMKRLNDYAEARLFDSDITRGWTLRVLLGAILGAIVAHIYDVNSLGPDIGAIDEDIVAFLTGIGTKVIYGAIDQTVEALASKLGLSTLRKAKQRPSDVTEAVMKMIAETDHAKDPERMKALQELSKELQRRQ